jgi:hypothetical protein
MRSIILALILLVTMATAAAAESTFGLSWNPSIPVGNTADFAGGFSWRGGTLEWRNYVRSDMTVGASFGWLVMTDKFEGTVTEGPLTVTGKTWSYINTLPMHLTAYKYFDTDRRGPRWYAGLGAGTNWMEYRREVGYYAFQESQWHFAVAPEVGVQMPWNSWVGYFGVRYQHAFAAGDFESQGWFDFKIGFGLD